MTIKQRQCLLTFLGYNTGGKKYAYEQEDEREPAGNCGKDWYDNE